jgi:glycosyltransferase involved in cell wall biosynthesis
MTVGAQADVSVVIPCYRCSATIGRALASVATQSLLPAEVILVEDCSGDDTLSTLHTLQREYPSGWIEVISLPENRGPGEARNEGWDRAKQPYIAFLDADDTWHRDKIKIQYGWMSQQPKYALTGHKMARHDTQINVPMRFQTVNGEFAPISTMRLLWSNCFQTSSVMLRRDLSARFAVGKYHCEDYHLWLSIACANKCMVRCDLPLAFMHKAPFGEDGLSSQIWKMQKGELDAYRRIKKSGCISANHFLFLYAWSWVRFLRRIFIAKVLR